ncbi:MAG TPA: Holliday junction branch migration protein RuvA [Actinomycetota bacterium]|nr:Holliday junction branch migration protein RuvA [Actinomycetota bacterium]
MIGFLRGKVVAKTPDGCFLDVAGVGYRLACSATTVAALPTEGAETRLWTHLHVREDVLALFGFATESEQRIFEALLGVTGVGPKVALQVCSAFTPDALRKALVTDDVASISSVPGIGKKTAQRMVIDLKEKLALPDLEVVGARPDTLAKARSALENLGYSPGEVRVALNEATPADEASVEDIVKSALRVLAG